jgi:hypothetical protein
MYSLRALFNSSKQETLLVWYAPGVAGTICAVWCCSPVMSAALVAYVQQPVV